jgi:hypothetical protein
MISVYGAGLAGLPLLNFQNRTAKFSFYSTSPTREKGQ